MFHISNAGKMIFIDLSSDTTVNASTAAVALLRPPVGSIYKIIAFYYKADDPVGSSAGLHSLEITLTDGDIGVILASIESDFGTDIEYSYSEVTSATAFYPQDATRFDRLISRLHSGHDAYLDFHYYNDTDVNQTGTRELYILVEAVPEV